jgi:hypothetical protein
MGAFVNEHPSIQIIDPFNFNRDDASWRKMPIYQMRSYLAVM